MRIVALLAFVIVGCKGEGAKCPTVDELMRDGAIRKEIEVVVQRCRADSWSAETVTCLRSAKTDAAMEPCFKQLTKDQASRLERAFAPMAAALDEQAEAENDEADQQFGRQLADRKLEQMMARARECKMYVEAIEEARATSRKCTSSSASLEQFGMQQLVLKQLDALAPIEDAAVLAAACMRDAATLRESTKTACHQATDRP